MTTKRRPKPCADLQCGRCAMCLYNERQRKRVALEAEAAKVRRMAERDLRESPEAMLTRIADEHRQKWNERG